MEIGTGDSVAYCLIARKYGTKTCLNIDTGDYTTKRIAFYQNLTHEININI